MWAFWNRQRERARMDAVYVAARTAAAEKIIMARRAMEDTETELERWRGKPLAELSREELIDAVRTLERTHRDLLEWQVDVGRVIQRALARRNDRRE